MSDKFFGRNAVLVLEAIQAGNKTINKILVSKTAHGSTIEEIIKLVRQKGILVNYVPSDKFDKFDKENTQVVVAEISATNCVEIEDLINMVKNKKTNFWFCWIQWNILIM